MILQYWRGNRSLKIVTGMPPNSFGGGKVGAQLTKNTADDNCPNWRSPRVLDSGIYDTNGTISETLPAS
jgi:hypothetical protein